MGIVTHEQANLMLQLYDLRREEELRKARTWFISKFAPQSLEDYQRIAPFGSQENAWVRMVLSYWDMAANIVHRGLVDEEFFFENTGEQWLVWERFKPVIAGYREMLKNPKMFDSLEDHVRHYEAWRERRAPGSLAALRGLLDTMARGQKAAGA